MVLHLEATLLKKSNLVRGLKTRLTQKAGGYFIILNNVFLFYLYCF